jgi:hypothetical protein
MSNDKLDGGEVHFEAELSRKIFTWSVSAVRQVANNRAANQACSRPGYRVTTQKISLRKCNPTRFCGVKRMGGSPVFTQVGRNIGLRPHS